MLAANFEVLSTKIFFAIAGAQYDPGRAAVLAAVLLAMTLFAFWLQQRWLGRASYVTVTGKGDGGAPAALPKSLWRACFGIGAIWIAFTLVCYAVIFSGGFVRDIGRGVGETTPSHLSWISTTYTIALASSVVAIGRIGDRTGRRRIFLIGFGLRLLRN